MHKFLLAVFCQSRIFLSPNYDLSYLGEWGLCLKRSITIAFPFQHVNIDCLELFLVRSMMGRLFYRRYTEAPILACTAILKSLYLKVELSLFILQ